MHLLCIVVACGSLEDRICSLVSPESALEIHVRDPRVEALLTLGKADVLHGSLSHLSSFHEIAHLQVEGHVANPHNGRITLREQKPLEVLCTFWIVCPLSISILSLPLLEVFLLCKFLGFLLAFRRLLCFTLLVLIASGLLVRRARIVHLEVRKVKARAVAGACKPRLPFPRLLVIRVDHRSHLFGLLRCLARFLLLLLCIFLGVRLLRLLALALGVRLGLLWRRCQSQVLVLVLVLVIVLVVLLEFVEFEARGLQTKTHPLAVDLQDLGLGNLGAHLVGIHGD
mmetsp:Transcript_35284/g.56779  ORF Transcript_35284/g.56779 Transcript_35284/m.56779 type:complete len:284 (+) Transcript_35284:231-1082(+)